jgi:hypothetical protein
LFIAKRNNFLFQETLADRFHYGNKDNILNSGLMEELKENKKVALIA